MAPSATHQTSSSTTQLSSKPEASQYVHPDDLRTAFSQAMSAMYRNEVPLYGDLIRIVNTTNTAILESSHDAKIEALRSNGNVAAERLDLERHGAIRLGKPEELHTVSRLFAIIGLSPVGYYDLSVAGLPMHATAFRPTSPQALKRNPFRVFTTLLRPELLVDSEARDLALSLLARRNIFSPKLMQLIDLAESPAQNGQLTLQQADVFVKEAMKTFSWHAAAVATEQEYLKLKSEHPILADIACFQSAHINHLTPRTLEIETAQDQMLDEGLAVKDRIEGPPKRKCPILLRQTSFLALEEKIKFPQSLASVAERSIPEAIDEETLLDDTTTEPENNRHKNFKIGTHKARFGEIEERGAAVTPLGRKLYDRLLDETAAAASASSTNPASHARQHHQRMDEASERIFGKSYPDTWDALRQQGLVYFTYTPTQAGILASNCQTPGGGIEGATIETLLDEKLIEATPLTYEDFLPFSAAGIFQSNLSSGGGAGGDGKGNSPATSPSKQPGQVKRSVADVKGLERAMGREVLDSDHLYAAAQAESLRHCEAVLGLPERCL